MRLRSVALPTEHGSWSLALEPVVLGLLLAPSASGGAVLLGVSVVFLLRRPLQVAIARGGTTRRRAAAGIALGYGVVAAAAWASAALAGGPRVLLAVAAAAPFAVVAFVAGTHGRSRAAGVEVAAAAAFGLLGVGPLLAAGAPLDAAALVVALALCRSLPAVAYVRLRVARERGRPSRVRRAGVVGVHAAVAVAVLAAPWLPWVAATPYVALLGRAALGLSGIAWPRSIRAVGATEVVLGVGWLATLAVTVDAV